MHPNEPAWRTRGRVRLLLVLVAAVLWFGPEARGEPLTGSGNFSGDGGSGEASVTVGQADNWDSGSNPSPPLPPLPNQGTITKTFTSLGEIVVTFPYNFTGGQGSPSPYTTFTFQEGVTNMSGSDSGSLVIELGTVDTAGGLCGIGNFCPATGAIFTPGSTVNGLPHFSNSLPDSPFMEALTGFLAHGDTAQISFEVAVPADNPVANWAIRQTLPEPGTALLRGVALSALLLLRGARPGGSLPRGRRSRAAP